jgi:hypothetical protein
MNRYELRGCLELTVKMSQLPLFQPIQIPRDLRPGDLTSAEELVIRSCPADPWSPILNKLHQNGFPDFQSWKDEIAKYWLPALTALANASLLYLLAQEQRAWFQRHSLKVPHTQKDDWIVKFAALTKRFLRLTEAPPPGIISNHGGPHGNG